MIYELDVGPKPIPNEFSSQLMAMPPCHREILGQYCRDVITGLENLSEPLLPGLWSRALVQGGVGRGLHEEVCPRVHQTSGSVLNSMDGCAQHGRS